MKLKKIVSPKWVNYKHLKNVDDFVKASKSDSFLKKMLDRITFKKVVTTGIVGGTTAILATEVQNYIHDNSGCFLYSGSKKKCKVAELSCCQPAKSQNIPLCANFQNFINICQGYDKSKSNDCCRFCDEKKYHFLQLGETLKCSSPTISDALANLSSKVIAYPGNFLYKFGLLILALFVFMLFIFVIKS